MSDYPTTTPDYVEQLRPVIAAMIELTETRIMEAITPLMAQIAGLEVMTTEQATRIAELEAQLAKLTGEARP